MEPKIDRVGTKEAQAFVGKTKTAVGGGEKKPVKKIKQTRGYYGGGKRAKKRKSFGRPPSGWGKKTETSKKNPFVHGEKKIKRSPPPPWVKERGGAPKG